MFAMILATESLLLPGMFSAVKNTLVFTGR